MVHRLVYVVVSLILFSSCKKDIQPGRSINSFVETAPVVQTAVNITINNSINGFYEALPAHYSESGNTYPLLISLHGGGQIGNGGNELPLVLNDGIAQIIAAKKFPPSFSVQGNNFSFIVLSPQFNKYPALEEVYEFLAYAKRRYRVDTSRIYLAGLSMGGFITSRMGAEYPAQFAAIVPVSGAENDTSVCRRIAQGSLPVWALHNRFDPSINVTGTEGFISLLKSFGPEVAPRLTVFNTSGHDAWTAAFNPAYKEEGLNVYEWMLQYTR